MAFLIKGQDIVASAIAFLLRDPPDFPREVGPFHLPQALLFEFEDHFLTIMPEPAIEEIALGRIELAHKPLNQLWSFFLGLARRRRFDEKLRAFGESPGKSFRVLSGRMFQQMSLYRIHDRILEVYPGLVSVDPG